MNRTRLQGLQIVTALVLWGGLASNVHVALAQAAAAPAVPRVVGTVKSISGGTLTVAPDGASAPVIVTAADSAKVLQLAPGSTDLKTAKPATPGDIAVGDRVLIQGHVGDPAGQISAARVILMKSTAIAARNADAEADWQKRGAGGIVTAVDPSTGTITVSAGARKTEIQTGSSTIFRRYASDSVNFADAKAGSMAEIHAGDQLRVRGDHEPDGAIKAEEVVSGSFLNLAGTISQVDPATGTLSLKDLATKKNFTVKVTPNSDLRELPAQAATMLAARAHVSEAGSAGQPQGERPASAREGERPAGAGGARRGGGADLSSMLPRLPKTNLSGLKPGEAVMIVATEEAKNSGKATAVTLLTGVEPILAASPATGGGMTLSPWSVGGGAPDTGGGAQ